MKALKAMIDRVLEPRDDSKYNYAAANLANYTDF